jgi:plasmid stabilization system protein ParE
MYKVLLLPLASQDIREAAHWYNEQSPGLGKRFTATVRKTVRYIRKNPTAVAIRYDDTRTALLDNFPYMVHFTIDEQKKLIVISAVLSTHRDPGIWKER